jgi:hypothetical protein
LLYSFSEKDSQEFFVPAIESGLIVKRGTSKDAACLQLVERLYPSRERFLTELTLDPPDATSDHAGALLLDEDYLILSTIHSPRGRNGNQFKSLGSFATV